MAWIESHQTLRNHPKLFEFSKLIGQDRVVLTGHLLWLWWWCMDYAPDGDLTKFNHHQIALAAGWEGDPSKFVDALINSGFVDENGEKRFIHDWLDFCGEIIKKRIDRKQARRKVAADICRIPPDSAKTPPTNQPTQPTNQSKAVAQARKSPPVDKSVDNYKTSNPLQEVVLGFKYKLGVDLEDRQWDKVYFKRYSKPAKHLLMLFGEDKEKALLCIEAVVDWLESKSLSWTPETVVKHASEWGQGKLNK